MPARYLPAYAPVAVYLAVIVTVLPFTRSTVTLASEDLGRPLILAAAERCREHIPFLGGQRHLGRIGGRGRKAVRCRQPFNACRIAVAAIVRGLRGCRLDGFVTLNVAASMV